MMVMSIIRSYVTKLTGEERRTEVRRREVRRGDEKRVRLMNLILRL